LAVLFINVACCLTKWIKTFSDDSEGIRESGSTCLRHSASPLDVEGWFDGFF
jgi:hypothetical protein